MRLGPFLALTMATASLLAGCIVADDQAFRSEGVEYEPAGDVSPSVVPPTDATPGVETEWVLRVEHRGPPGAGPFPYNDGECLPAWSVALRASSGDMIPLHAPRAYCEAIGIAYLHPGENLSSVWSWDLRRWDADEEAYRPLAPDEYRLEFSFNRQEAGAEREDSPRAIHRFSIA